MTSPVGRPATSGSFKPGYDPRRYKAQALRDRKSVQELCREKSHAAVNALAQIMEDPEEKSSDRIRAAEALLNRGFGTPANTIAMEVQASTGPQGDAQSMSLDDLRRAVADALLGKTIEGEVVQEEEAPPGDS